MAGARRRTTTRDEWGSITRTEDDAWRLRYRGPDGRRRDGGRFATRAEADDARVRIRASILGGVWRPAGTKESPLLADYAASWLQRTELAEELSPRTVALYRGMFARLVLPDVGGIELGRVPIGRLTRETVMAWELAARARSRDSAARHAGGMTGAAAARRRGHPARAWARSVGLPVPLTARLPSAGVRAWQDAGSPPSRPHPRAAARATGSSSTRGRRCPRYARPRSRTATWSNTRCGCGPGPDRADAGAARRARPRSSASRPCCRSSTHYRRPTTWPVS